MAKESSKAKETTLPPESGSQVVEPRKVLLSQAAVRAYQLTTVDAELVEQGEVESVVEVKGERYVVGNEEVKEA